MATSKNPQYRQSGGYSSTSNAASAGAQEEGDNGVYTPGRAGRIDGRARNVLYTRGTGQGTGRTGSRTAFLNRDGTPTKLSAMGSALGPLSPTRPSMLPDSKKPAGAAEAAQKGGANRAATVAPTTAATGETNVQTPNAVPADASQEDNSDGVHTPGRAGRIDGRAKNALYAPGTGPGTGRTGIRIGIRNRDGTTSSLSAMGSVMGPLSPTRPSMLPDTKPKPAPAGPLPTAMTPGLDGTIKASTQRFGSSPAQGVKPPAPLTPPVIASSTTLPSSNKPVVAPNAITAGPGGTMNSSSMTFVTPQAGGISTSGLLNIPPLDKKIPGRAMGGPVQAGRPYLVGEEGPEIIVPKQSGTVVPNHALQEREADSAVTGGARRQTSGLMMRPRPMPPEFAQEKMRGGMPSDEERATDDVDAQSATSWGDEADEHSFDESPNPEKDVAVIGRADRQTSGLMMRPRPMPPEFAQEKMRGGMHGRRCTR